MFCHNCGTQIGSEANFCPTCGAPQKPLLVGKLTGLWLGYGYTCRGAESPELIKIELIGNKLQAVKITGDDCIRSGEITWTGVYSGYTFPVQVQFSGGPNSRHRSFVSAVLQVVDSDFITVSSEYWMLTYRRVRV